MFKDALIKPIILIRMQGEKKRKRRKVNRNDVKVFDTLPGRDGIAARKKINSFAILWSSREYCSLGKNEIKLIVPLLLEDLLLCTMQQLFPLQCNLLHICNLAPDSVPQDRPPVALVTLLQPSRQQILVGHFPGFRLTLRI